MATAEELLVNDQCDDILLVDLESRRIIIPDTIKNLGVESDDSVRVLHFRVPRQYCEVDLSTFAIRVNYKNTSGSGGSYDISNPIMESDMILFDWVVARQVTVKKGDVLFNVCLREMMQDEVEREFNTAIATLPVLEGLESVETDEEFVETVYDFLDQLKEYFGDHNPGSGSGSGDMLAQVYDPQGKREDIYAYVDEKTKDIDVDVTADEVTFADGQTFQQKYDSGELTGRPGKDGTNGKDGADGYTPVKGTDYFTAADKTEMVNAVLAALPAAEEASF